MLVYMVKLALPPQADIPGGESPTTSDGLILEVNTDDGSSHSIRAQWSFYRVKQANNIQTNLRNLMEVWEMATSLVTRK